MGMFDKLWGKKLFGKSDKPVEPETKIVATPKVKKPRKPKEKKVPELSAKEKATQAGEPYVNVLSMEVDPTNIHEGSFELDWNDKFIANLVRAGYQIRKDDSDADIVDRWFQNVCRHVVMETWEQEQAIRSGFIQERNLGDGRSEVS